jgi:NAD(P)-dependent dehydrogenase (short-subunit alcohol dehydrogenase family)
MFKRLVRLCNTVPNKVHKKPVRRGAASIPTETTREQNARKGACSCLEVYRLVVEFVNIARCTKVYQKTILRLRYPDCIIKYRTEKGNLMQLTNKGVLVTGGASGLGAACVRLLQQAGAKVVIADFNSETGTALVKELGEGALFVKTDVVNEGDMQAAVQAVVEKFGGLHVLINCAGIVAAERVLGKVGPSSLASFTRVIQVNLIGTYNAIRLAAAALAKNEPNEGGERGVIVNTASVAAFDGQIGQAAYSASKGGIVSMTLPIARELARFGIRVMTIAPGIFDTPMLAGLPEPARISLGQQVPFPPRLGRPSEYAALAKHIIENEMLNGEVIRLDGGIRMQPK